jgi:hypothetical protein
MWARQENDVSPAEEEKKYVNVATDMTHSLSQSHRSRTFYKINLYPKLNHNFSNSRFSINNLRLTQVILLTNQQRDNQTNESK